MHQSPSSSSRPTVQLVVDGSARELPVIRPTEGNDGVGISTLLNETGLVTFDPGYTNTASTESAITYIDGDAGVLRYRGYPIEQLAERSTFTEVSHLLMHGELPKADELEAFETRVKRHTHLPEGFAPLITNFPAGGHPMAMLQAAVAALASFYQHTLDPKDPEQVELATVLLFAKVPTLVAAIHRQGTRQDLVAPDPSLGYVEDFLRMTFAPDSGDYDVDPAVARALDMLLILHADHEQNCSTSTVRMVGSANASIYASMSAGVGALSGPLHGGANEAVLDMLTAIQASDDDVDTFMRRVKNKENGIRLMGFGHRVYKNYDPRAAIVKKAADEVLEKLGVQDELLDIAMKLEEIALNDEYFIERKLYPNVDFYTGIIYKAMGFPTEMFTPLFALGRMPGWLAQWREMMTDPQTKIGRPRQIYTGATARDYVAMPDR